MSQLERKPAAAREQRDIEWLVNWALEKQGLGYDDSAGAVSSGGGWQALGTRIDGGGFGGMGASQQLPHADAMIIVEALNSMRRDSRVAKAADLVAVYGRAGIQPDWGKDGSGRWQLVRKNKAGRSIAVKRFADQTRRRGLLGFEWEWVGHQPETLDLMMIEWSAWHTALIELRNLINQKMTTYNAVGPVAPDSPWDVGHVADDVDATAA